MAKHEEKTFAGKVKKMTTDEIGIELKTLRDRLYTLRSQSVTEKVEDHSQFGITKRNVARLLTEQSSRRISGAGEPRTPKTAGKRAAAPAKSAAKRAPAKAPKATAAKSPRKAGASARSAKSAKTTKTAKASK